MRNGSFKTKTTRDPCRSTKTSDRDRRQSAFAALRAFPPPLNFYPPADPRVEWIRGTVPAGSWVGERCFKPSALSTPIKAPLLLTCSYSSFFPQTQTILHKLPRAFFSQSSTSQSYEPLPMSSKISTLGAWRHSCSHFEKLPWISTAGQYPSDCK